jgi:sarcosine oxidase
MDRTDYEAVVVGVGGMGSAAVAHLAARGVDVLGIERFDVPHANGSSHGETRIVRAAYGEGAAYVPLVARAYELWRDLESTASERLLTVTGSVTAGPPGDDLVPDAVAACEAHDLAHEVVGGATLTDRYAALSVPASYRAVVQPDGGFLAAERCVAAHVDRAHAAGAEVHGRERVVDWRAPESGGPVRVTTDRGTYVADHLVVAAGAWTGRVCPALGDALTPERQVQAWL